VELLPLWDGETDWTDMWKLAAALVLGLGLGGGAATAYHAAGQRDCAVSESVAAGRFEQPREALASAASAAPDSYVVTADYLDHRDGRHHIEYGYPQGGEFLESVHVYESAEGAWRVFDVTVCEGAPSWM
jgi:hypothetical protein